MELGEKLGVSGNYIYLMESGQKTPGESLLKLFEIMESSPASKSEFFKEAMNPRFSESSTRAFQRISIETLKQNIAENAGHLRGADVQASLTLLEDLREMMGVLSMRLRSKAEASSKGPSELQSAAKRASSSARTDPSE